MIVVQDPDLTIHVGDVREVLPTLPGESVDCVATSPPFYGLRDYGTGTWEGGDPGCDHARPRSRRDGAGRERPDLPDPPGSWAERDARVTEAFLECECGARRTDHQIGLEATPDEWAAELVTVFRECRRLLRPHGTLWVECGDSYAQIDGTSYAGDTREVGQNGAFNIAPSLAATKRSRKSAVPPGYKRKDLIGAPWLLAFALRADGWYLRQCIVWHKPNAMPESVRDRCTTAHSYVFLLSKGPRYFFDADAIGEESLTGDMRRPYGSEGAWQMDGRPLEQRHGGELRNVGNRQTNGQKPRTDERRGFDNRLERANGMKNARSVWTIPTRGYPGAHFATWPETLAERIILAGCSEGGTVLDPFLGAGTTGLVARRLGRRCVGVELSEEYARMAAERCQQLSLLAEIT